MFKIVNKKMLNPTVCEMDIEAPLVARKADAGQFIILRVDEKGERIPLTVADYDRKNGTVSIIFQVVGASTKQLEMKNKGDYIQDFAGPLGRATEVEGLKKVCVVGGGVGGDVVEGVVDVTPGVVAAGNLGNTLHLLHLLEESLVVLHRPGQVRQRFLVGSGHAGRSAHEGLHLAAVGGLGFGGSPPLEELPGLLRMLGRAHDDVRQAGSTGGTVDELIAVLIQHGITVLVHHRSSGHDGEIPQAQDIRCGDLQAVVGGVVADDDGRLAGTEALVRGRRLVQLVVGVVLAVLAEGIDGFLTVQHRDTAVGGIVGTAVLV